MIQILSKRLLSEAEKTKRKLTVLGFDELNVLNQVDALYADFEKECSGAFWEVYRMRYEEICVWLKGKLPDEDLLDELVDMYLADLQDEPNPNTHYSFKSELIRKRDRAKEAIIAVPTKVQKQIELDKAVRYVIQQSAWYIDFASQDAEIQAYKDAGVEKVKRNEMNDDRTCGACERANGAVYAIDKIPPLPHLRCRRWFEPYYGRK